MWQNLEILLPWGQQNPEPMLLIHNVHQSDFSGVWNVDIGNNSMPKDVGFDCVAMWRSINQLRIMKIIEE
jgi:hypothetical protein